MSAIPCGSITNSFAHYVCGDTDGTWYESSHWERHWNDVYNCPCYFNTETGEMVWTLSETGREVRHGSSSWFLPAEPDCSESTSNQSEEQPWNPEQHWSEQFSKTVYYKADTKDLVFAPDDKGPPTLEEVAREVFGTGEDEKQAEQEEVIDLPCDEDIATDGGAAPAQTEASEMAAAEEKAQQQPEASSLWCGMEAAVAQAAVQLEAAPEVAAAPSRSKRGSFRWPTRKFRTAAPAAEAAPEAEVAEAPARPDTQAAAQEAAPSRPGRLSQSPTKVAALSAFCEVSEQEAKQVLRALPVAAAAPAGPVTPVAAAAKPPVESAPEAAGASVEAALLPVEALRAQPGSEATATRAASPASSADGGWSPAAVDRSPPAWPRPKRRSAFFEKQHAEATAQVAAPATPRDESPSRAAARGKVKARLFTWGSRSRRTAVVAPLEERAPSAAAASFDPSPVVAAEVAAPAAEMARAAELAAETMAPNVEEAVETVPAVLLNSSPMATPAATEVALPQFFDISSPTKFFDISSPAKESMEEVEEMQEIQELEEVQELEEAKEEDAALPAAALPMGPVGQGLRLSLYLDRQRKRQSGLRSMVAALAKEGKKWEARLESVSREMEELRRQHTSEIAELRAEVCRLSEENAQIKKQQGARDLVLQVPRPLGGKRRPRLSAPEPLRRDAEPAPEPEVGAALEGSREAVYRLGLNCNVTTGRRLISSTPRPLLAANRRL